MIYLFEMFAGYGGASFALKKANIPFECVGFSEIDKYAIKCFEQNHMYNKFINDSDEVIVTPRNYGDAREIDPANLHDFDLLTAGFPCQAFSSAGKMLGEADSRGTLFNEIIRIAEVMKPKYMLLENVKGLLTKRFKSTFEKILSELNRIGYNVHWKVLNSKDFGIPQSRARVWFVCIRKDIDEPFKFQFPHPTELKIFIKDILEPTVDKKYYLSEKLQERFNKYLLDKKLTEIPLLSSPFGGFKSDELCGTLGAGCGVSASKTNYVLNEDKNEMKWYGRDIKTGKKGINPLPEAHRVYDSEGIAQTIKPIGLKIFDHDDKIIAIRQRDRHNKNEEKIQLPEAREDGCSNSLTSVNKDNIVLQKHRSEGIREYNGTIPTLGKEPGGDAIVVYDRKGFDSRTKGFRESELSPTLSTKMGTGGNNVPMILGNLYEKGGEMGNVFSPEKVSPTITGYHKGDSIKIQETLNNVPIILHLCGDRDNPTLSVKEDVANTLNANEYSDRQNIVAISNSSKREMDFKEDVCPTILARDYKDPKVVSNIINSIEKSGDLEQPKILDLYNQTGNNDISITLTEPHHNNLRLLSENQLRRLTPKECFRLQGFLNDEIDLDGLSDTQCYKLAGNGWEINLASKILYNLLKDEVKI